MIEFGVSDILDTAWKLQFSVAYLRKRMPRRGTLLQVGASTGSVCLS